MSRLRPPAPIAAPFRARRLSSAYPRRLQRPSAALQPPVVALVAVGDVRARIAADAIRDALRLYEPSCHVRFTPLEQVTPTELEADAMVLVATGRKGHLHPAVNAFLARRAGTDLRGQPIACVSVSDAHPSAASWAEGLVRFERSRGATPVLPPLLLVGDPIVQEAGIRRWTMAFLQHLRVTLQCRRGTLVTAVRPAPASA